MKKTLIALAVAASAAVSGSAMAWTPNGSGGSVEMGGIFSPASQQGPWEVKVGDVVKGLDATLEKGQKTVEIPLKSAIPLLGIRTQTSEAFKGQQGISPQISYGDVVDVDSFSEGMTSLTLDIKDSQGEKLGKVETIMGAAAIASFKGSDMQGVSYVYASGSGSGFFGGVAKKANGVNHDPEGFAEQVFPEVEQHYNRQDVSDMASPAEVSFSDNTRTFSAFYVSAIPVSSTINITLDKEISGTVQWNASLPITVSYA
ncbi:fimbrial protein [Escherichia sp. MOD1-EC7011]|uniref:F4 family fimbrial subunit n=1 Tax=Escherichia sp. MOD1-EC7011 TaxID=2093901 RepID=UPI000CF763A9|nr:fimbrial protein [Escherichia sp. MOD1-EC7011]